MLISRIFTRSSRLRNALFAVNEYAIKPALPAVEPEAGYSFIELVMLGYFNDVLGGLAFMAYTNLLISLVQPRYRVRNPLLGVAYIFLCGLFWEYASPLFRPDAVADPWDLLAYCTGAVLYWTVVTAWEMARGHGTSGRKDSLSR